MDTTDILFGLFDYGQNWFRVAVDKNNKAIGTVTIYVENHTPPVKVTGAVPPVIVAEIIVAYYRDNIAFGIMSWDGDEYLWDEVPEPRNN